MKKLRGIIVSTKMNNTIVVEVTWKSPHPIYRKLLKKSKKYKVDTNGKIYNPGENVVIIETRPIAKDKHFKVLEK